MKTKPLIITIALLLLSNISYPQDYKYSYDASGNRIKREVKTSAMSAMPLARNDSVDLSTDEDIVTEEPEETTGNTAGEAFRTVLYPNPTYGYFTIELPEFKQGESGQIMIYDQTGNLIVRQKYVSSTQDFDISSIPAGIYIVRILVNDKLVIKRIIKQ